MPSVMCMDWLHWWYNPEAPVVSSLTALVFLTDAREKCKSTSPNTIQVKNRRQNISFEEKLDVLIQLGKGEKIIEKCLRVRLSSNSTHTICDNADRIKKELSQKLKCLCSKTTTVLFQWTVQKTKDISFLHFYCIRHR
jgi:hypothetical protein